MVTRSYFGYISYSQNDATTTTNNSDANSKPSNISNQNKISSTLTRGILIEDRFISVTVKNSRRRCLNKLVISQLYSSRLLVAVVAVWFIIGPFPPSFSPKQNNNEPPPVGSRTSLVAANEMFDEANETPGGGNDGFNDDDDDDDGGAMDSSASNDYPEADGGGSGDDPDDDPDGGESRQGSGSWILPGANAHTAGSGYRKRWKRDIDDRASVIQRRQAIRAKRRSMRLKRPQEEEFSVDDGDEDAWVHDGVDDIHIDPETKQAASELSHETDKSIDAEYEPHQEHEQDAIVINGTRLTTIAEVIPMRSDDIESRDKSGSGNNREPTRISSRFSRPPKSRPVGASIYLPAAYLSMDQVVRLMDHSAGGPRRSTEDD